MITRLSLIIRRLLRLHLHQEPIILLIPDRDCMGGAGSMLVVVDGCPAGVQGDVSSISVPPCGPPRFKFG